jgi:hypothetical protein
MAKSKSKSKSKPKPTPTAIPFAFFGAGEATYFEQASLTVVFAAAPTAVQRAQIERGIPAPLECSGWTKRTLHVATDDHALVGWDDFAPFNAAIERWLHASHAIAPIDFALRAEDSEAGTVLSDWHRNSLPGALALVTNLAKRYDDGETRGWVKETLVDMLKAAGIALPARLDPQPAWRAALDAGDAKRFAPLMTRHAQDLQLVLDPRNPDHRRAVLGGRPALAKHGLLDTKIFEMALFDDTADGQYVIDRFLARATREPFWSTACAAAAAEVIEDVPDRALAVLDRLVELANAHPIVVENALWAVEELGPRTVARARLERYWALAVAKLADWEELRPYLVKLAPVLGHEPPPRVTARPAAKKHRTGR